MSQSKLLRLQVLARSVYHSESAVIHVKLKSKSILASLAVSLMNIPQLDFYEEV